MQETLRSYLPGAQPTSSSIARAGSALDVAQVASTSVATFRHKLIPTPERCDGDFLARPKRGAKGIAGLRADILEGKLTIREVAMMPIAVLRHRYKVSPQYARRMRAYVAKYGVDGRKRLLNGMPRDLAASE